jgi:hypothetical protein
MLKDAILLAAEQLGEIKRVAVLDEYGKPTGEYEFEYSGVDGLLGYLRWAGINRPASFLSLLGRVLPCGDPRLDNDDLEGVVSATA